MAFKTIRRRELDQKYFKFGGLYGYLQYLREVKMLTIAEIARDTGLGVGTVHRSLRKVSNTQTHQSQREESSHAGTNA